MKGLLGSHKKDRGLSNGGQPNRMAVITICFIFSVVLIVGIVIIQCEWTQIFPKVPGDSANQQVALKDGYQFSDFGSLGVPWFHNYDLGCSFFNLLRLKVMAYYPLLATERSRRGSVVKWTRDDLLHAVKEFVPIYHARPIKNNKFGMGFDNSFGVWFITRWLKPDLMIESGALKGHSTWVLRQAMPSKPIITITPLHPENYLKEGPAFVDPNCRYYSGKQFIDFGSISWKSVMEEYGISDQSKVVVFFDDHQNELKRLKQALRAGFRHLIFEDNYDTGTGDMYTLRQICDQFHIKGGGHSCYEESDEARMRAIRKHFWEKALDIKELCGPGDAWWGVRGEVRDNFNQSIEPMSHAEHFENSKFVESVLDLYWELPPIAGPSLTHQTRYDPARTSKPIIPDDQRYLFRKLGLSNLNKSVFNGYTQMVYVKISE